MVRGAARRASGRLAPAREAALDDLGFSWTSPSDVDDPVAQRDWGEMCRKFAAYRAAAADGQVPKKYKLDPSLGGWVAAVRRARATLGEARTAELDALGFEWVSTRQCGSAFMHSFRELRAFYDEHGHTDVRRVDGDDAPLARWCAAQRTAYGRGAAERSGYLDGIEFEWPPSGGGGAARARRRSAVRRRTVWATSHCTVCSRAMPASRRV